ncbi:ABC transporter ATP-binding protein [Microlunatus parietis]|uniref:ATP-binding cassette subfamily C protein n=1 Tax=Microlunatus parietis TaxID=682979 RepID=A0A7Y9I9W0_9ACTN|nr:ABC transporter ATP-binding protein [Microlunatus parietis]NYE72954.1 ATP-binding cassette subfamily C protein [Microlunatus parietis]
MTTTTGELLPIATGRVTARAVLRQVLAHPRQWIPALLLSLASSAGTVALPILLGALVDQVPIVARTGDTGPLAALIVALVLVMLAGVVLTAAAGRALQRLAAQVGADLRERVVERALRLDTRVLERAGHGDIASRVTDDVELFMEAIPVLSGVTASLITVVVAAIGFVSLDWRLALAFAAVLPVHVIGLRWYLPKAGPRYAAERRLAAERSRVLLSSLRGRPTVQAYQMAELQSGRLRSASASALEATVGLVRLVARFGLCLNGAEAVGLSAVLATGFLLVNADLVSVGAVTAAALLFHRLFGPLGWLLMSVDDVQRAGAALSRMVGVAGIPDPEPAPLPAPRGPVTVRAEGVDHAYVEGRLVLDRVDLELPAAGSVALVGASGAGKTTLAGIIGGAITPTQGRVVLSDGERELILSADTVVDEDELRDWVGIVAQETYVFTGTLREELTLARPGITDDEIWMILERVVADGWVRALPDGLDTPVGPNTAVLSAAHVQQLALARLLARNPPLVVLDEATAEAGSAGARQLEAAGRALIKDRTALVVAHRLTQARECDKIVVLDDGKIVEAGSHEELVAAGGRYAALWASWSAH